MNILIIGTTDTIGGAARVSWDIKSAMERLGHEISMFVADKKSDDPKVQIIPRIGWRKLTGFLLGTERFIDTNWILETPEFKKANLIHCHNLHGRFFNLETLQRMSLLKPVVWTLHDEWAITPHCACTFEETRLANGLYICPSINTPPRTLWNNDKNLAQEKNLIYQKSKLHLVTPSLWLKNKVEKTVLKKQDIWHIPNGIDTAIFTKQNKKDARQKLNLPLDKKIILFLADDAKSNTWKGWSYTEKIIEKFRAQKDILFVSVGNKQKYENKDNVIFIGHLADKKEIASYYNAADILLFTSIAENFPLVILEAMSCGLPIVSFDVGGVKEALIHQENGYIAKYKDVDDLEIGLKWFFSLSSEKKQQISLNSSQRIKDYFSSNLMIQRYLELFKQII